MACSGKYGSLAAAAADPAPRSTRAGKVGHHSSRAPLAAATRVRRDAGLPRAGRVPPSQSAAFRLTGAQGPGAMSSMRPGSGSGRSRRRRDLGGWRRRALRTGSHWQSAGCDQGGHATRRARWRRPRVPRRSRPPGPPPSFVSRTHAGDRAAPGRRCRRSGGHPQSRCQVAWSPTRFTTGDAGAAGVVEVGDSVGEAGSQVQ